MSADKGIERRAWVRSFLDGDRSHVKFTTISDYLDELIQSPADFLKVLASVQYVDRHLVIEAVQPRLQDLLQSAYDLILTVQMVKPDKHALIFDQIQYHIGKWINSLSDLIMLLKWIDTGHSRVVIKSLRKRQLEELIERAYEAELKTTYDKEGPRVSEHLLQVLQLVGNDNNRRVLEAVKASLDKWIASIQDFNLILGFLPEEDKKWLAKLLCLDNRIEQWVQSVADFNFVSGFLPSNLVEKLFEKYERKMDEWIQSAADFNLIMEYLPSEHHAELFRKIRPRVGELIQSAADFNLIMEYLPNESRVAVFGMVRSRIVGMIHTLADFNLIIRHTSLDLCLAVFDMTMDRVGELIQSAADLKELVPDVVENPDSLLFTNHMRRQVSERVKPRLGELIHTAADLEHVTKFLLFNPECETVFEIVKPRLGELIHTAADFVQVMKCYRYNKEICKTVVEITGPGLGKIIRSASDFVQVMKCFSDYDFKSRAIIFETLRPRLGELIQSAADFKQVMKSIGHHDYKLREATFETIRHRLGELVHTAADLGKIMVNFRKSLRTEVFELVRPRLGELIGSAEDFEQISKCTLYNKEMIEAALEITRPRLGAMIHSAADFKLITIGLTRDTMKTVFELIKPRLNDLIQFPSDLYDIYCNLGDAERQDLLGQLSLNIERLRELVNGADGLIKLLKCVHHDGVISILRIFKKIFPSGLSYTKENLQNALSLFHINYWVELLELFGGQFEAWVAPVFYVVCGPDFRCYPHIVTDEDRLLFLNSFWQRDPAIREAIISNPRFTWIMLNNIGEFSPKVRDSFRITAIKQRLQELSEGYKNLSSSPVHKIKKEVSDFLMQKTGELAVALIEKRCTDIRRLVQEIKQRIDEIRKDLRTQLMVFYGNPSRLGQVILDLQRLLNYPKPLFSKSRLTPLSIFSRGGAMSADDPAPEAEAEAKGPSSSAGGGGGGA